MSERATSTGRRRWEVEPIEPPRRASQTMLRMHDQCPRSAYLYVRYAGGAPTAPMERGTLFHAFAEEAMIELVARGEKKLYAEGAEGDVASLTAAMVDGILREHPEWHVPASEVDSVREMAYHWSLGNDVDPELVLGVERKFVLEVAGIEVSARVDLLAAEGDDGLLIDDLKTSQHVPTAEEYERGYQNRLYAVVAKFGRPVDRMPCDCRGPGVVLTRGGVPMVAADAGGRARMELALAADDRPQQPCQACGGRGYVEVLGDPIAEWAKWVHTRQVYPAPKLRDDGTLVRREAWLTPAELLRARDDLTRDVEALLERFGLREGPGAWVFPAQTGTHCSFCPAKGECPVPAELNDFRGQINTMEEAEEAAQRWKVEADRNGALREELKRFAKAQQRPIRVGVDEVLDFATSNRREVRKSKDAGGWDGLLGSIEQAVTFGEPFDVDRHIAVSSSSTFRLRRLREDERGE